MNTLVKIIMFSVMVAFSLSIFNLLMYLVEEDKVKLPFLSRFQSQLYVLIVAIALFGWMLAMSCIVLG